MSTMRKFTLVFAGVVALVVGVVGIFVPILPTTPFLLLAAACFVRSSERLYRWLMSHRWLGTYIRNYREHRAVTLSTKIIGLATLWGTIGYSMARVVHVWWGRGLLGLVALAVTVHLLTLRTLPRER